MKLWIISVGEPLPVDGENTRLRRMGNLASYASSNGVSVEWFSVSFDHYKKMQRCESDTDYCVNDNYVLHLVKSIPYKKNVSLARIRHHKNAGKSIYNKMNKIDKPDVIFASMEPLEVSKVAIKYAKDLLHQLLEQEKTPKDTEPSSDGDSDFDENQETNEQA